MKKPTSDKTSRKRTIITVLGITVPLLLMLVSVTGCVSFAGIPNLDSNNVSNLNKSDEAIKVYDKAIEINPQDSKAWYNKGLTLGKLGKLDEARIAYEKAIKIDPQLRSLAQ